MDKNLDIIFGIHPIIEAIKAKRRKIYKIYTTKDKNSINKEISKILPKDVGIIYTKREVLNKLCQSEDHQSIVAITSKFPFKKEIFKKEKDRFILLLDNIQDPRNLGAILRSAYCMAIDGIIIQKKDTAPLSGTAIKASSGLSEYLNIYYTNSNEESLKILKRDGYNIYLATIAGQNALKINYKYPLCLVVGNEAKGINKELIKYGTEITIPQKEHNISYNASVAASILMFSIKHLKDDI
jgi:23S rRNA (guanosine2251-2'-O)-methyltransferase